MKAGRKKSKSTIRSERSKLIQDTVDAMFVVIAYDMHNRNYKKETIEKRLKHIDYLFDCTISGHLELEDMQKCLKEEAGIDLSLS